jgi:hypothetical protein
MRTRIFAITVLFSFFVAKSGYAQNQIYYLPQVANGSYGSGSFRTTFILFNNGNSSAAVVLTLTDDNGNPFVVNIPGFGTSSQFALNLDSGAMQVLQTDGSGSVSAGAATVSSTASIGVSSIFTIYDKAGNFVTESGVGSSQLLADFTLPVDITGNLDTAVAFFNPGSSQVTITMRLLDMTGKVVASGVAIPLQGRGHTAAFVSQYFAKSNFRAPSRYRHPEAWCPLRSDRTGYRYRTQPCP